MADKHPIYALLLKYYDVSCTFIQKQGEKTYMSKDQNRTFVQF